MVLHTGDFKMDQLPLDGRITDLRAFARLGEEGVDLFLTDSTNAEMPGLHPVGEVDHPGHRPGLPRVHASASSWPASPPTCTACSRCSTPPSRTTARSPTSAARWCATWRSPATSATSPSPPGMLVDAKELADLPPERQVLISTGSPGRADERAEPDRAAQPQLRAHRGGRHRPARLEPDPGQRERRLPRHQRPGPLGRPRGPQGQRAGARLRATPAPASSSTATTSCSRATCCRCTARSGTCWPTPSWPGPPASRTSSSPRTASSSTSSTASPTIVGKVDCGYVFVDGSSVGDITESDLKDRRILGEEGFISVIVVVDSVSGKVSAGPEIHARGIALDDADFDDDQAADHRRARPRDRRGQHRHLPAAADRAPRRRPLGQQHPPASPDDHPGGHRGLSRTTTPSGRAPPTIVRRGRVRGVRSRGCRRRSTSPRRSLRLATTRTLTVVRLAFTVSLPRYVATRVCVPGLNRGPVADLELTVRWR